jgi:signal transduction histidine kinase
VHRLQALSPVAGWVGGRAVRTIVAAAILPIAVSVVWLAAASDHVEHPAATAVYRTYLAVAPLLIGVYWWHRRPSSRFGPVLIAFGIASWVMSWQSSDWPLAFDLGVLAEAPFTFLTFYLFLAFPSGHLETRADRLLMGAWLVVLCGFFLPWALGSPVIAGGGPLSTCVPACPANVLQIGSAPGLVETLGRWETYTGIVVTIAVLTVYLVRLRTASRPRRRALTAVAVTSLLFLPAFLIFHVSREILELDPDILTAMSWVVVGTRVLLPLGFLLALFQADRFAGAARGDLLQRLLTRPSPERWRDEVARALDDPDLRLAYWDPESTSFREPDGAELKAPEESDRAWVDADRDGRPVAVMVIDGALAEDPELVQAATSATLLAVENGNLEGEVRHSQARILAAGDSERRRIERDLHDSAQQRLVALRIHLAMATEQLDAGTTQHAMVERLSSEVDDAIDDIRTVARGVYPELLSYAGVAAALRARLQGAAIPVRVEDEWRRRHDQALELTVYFSCLEALQNAAKHAGTGATATVTLSETDTSIAFSVADDGVGFDPASLPRGAGLTNIADRVSAAGGTLRIESGRHHGTRVTGRIPVGRAAVSRPVRHDVSAR